MTSYLQLRLLVKETSILVAQKMSRPPLLISEVKCKRCQKQRCRSFSPWVAIFWQQKYTSSHGKENVTASLSLLQNVNQTNHDVSPILCGPSTCPSNYTVLQQRLKVLVAGGGRSVLVTAGEWRVDVDASQWGHGVFAVLVGLVTEWQVGGRGGAGGFLRDKESNEEGNDHSACP